MGPGNNRIKFMISLKNLLGTNNIVAIMVLNGVTIMNLKIQRYAEISEVLRPPEITLGSKLIPSSIKHALASYLVFNLTNFHELFLGSGHQWQVTSDKWTKSVTKHNSQLWRERGILFSEGSLNKDSGVRNNERESGTVDRSSWLEKTHKPRKISYDSKC